MNRLFGHLRCDIVDLITVTRKSRPWKPEAIREAGACLARSLSEG